MIHHPIFKFFSFILMASVMLAVTSCKKEDSDTTELVTDAEAAEIIESTVAERSGGLSQTIEESASYAQSSAGICGSTYDTAFQISYQFGQWSYTKQTNLSMEIICVNWIPQSANFTHDGSNNFSAPRWSGATETGGAYTLSGLQPSAQNYTVAGAYQSDGQLTGSLRNRDPQLNYTMQMNLANILVDKDSLVILGGSATVALTVSNAAGQTVTINGSLVFNGNGTATVTVNGYAYTFDL